MIEEWCWKNCAGPWSLMLPDSYMAPSFVRFDYLRDAKAFTTAHGGKRRKPTKSEMRDLRSVAELVMEAAGEPQGQA